MQCSKPRILRVVLDIVLYFSVFILTITMVYGPISPVAFRVTCDDLSIQKPYTNGTVSSTMLICLTLGVPFIVMTALEWAVPPPNDGPSPLRQGLRRSFLYLGDLFIGGVFTIYLTEVTKVATGEARPYFWNVCSPNITTEQCKQPYVELTWEDCTNPLKMSRKRVLDSMKSFPSGHASLSVFSSVFMIIYIKQRLWNRCSKLIAPWLQLLWATWTIICCQSRVWDNHHHWWDVLAGGLLGAFAGLLAVHYLSNWFIREECTEKGEISQDPGYVRHNSRFSHTPAKRLISTTSETDNHNDHRLDNRELTDINDLNLPEETMFSLLRL